MKPIDKSQVELKQLTKFSQISFVKSVARECGHNITDEQAIKAIKVCGDDYEDLKDYFKN